LREEHFNQTTLDGLRTIRRPQQGWLRAMREAAGLSAGQLGRMLGVSRQLPLQFEKAEADDRITLRTLRTVAQALSCDLVYALVPRTNPLAVPAESSKLSQPSPTHAEEGLRNEDHYFCD